MSSFEPGLTTEVRNKFAQVDYCPQQGKRIFFENAGGALTLKSVVETSATYAAIPDNQGRANAGSHELNAVIAKSKEDMRVFMNAKDGQFFVGESGTELLFRLIMNACLGVEGSGVVLGTTLEHPATRSACHRWAKIAGHTHSLLSHNDATGTVSSDVYREGVTSDTRVATIVHTSPVTGMGVDVAACAREIRKVAPDCLIIVDGIQHAAHGDIDIAHYDIDGYVVSPYKVFSRHGYGVAWISERLTSLPHDSLIGGPEENWEMGTRDTGAYATMSQVVSYFEWLGEQQGETGTRRKKIEAASKAIKNHERALVQAMVHGIGNLTGLADLRGVQLIGGVENPAREGLISMVYDKVPSEDLVSLLNERGIRTHLRKADHYSGNILEPLGLESCVRVSMCHYNSLDEVREFLVAMAGICAE